MTQLTGFISGDWAGGVWGAAGIPGQEQSCAQRTGFATCDEFVRSRGAAFQEACTCSTVLIHSYAYSLVHLLGRLGGQVCANLPGALSGRASRLRVVLLKVEVVFMVGTNNLSIHPPDESEAG